MRAFTECVRACVRARESAWERVRESVRACVRACVSRVRVVCGSVGEHELRVCFVSVN